MTKAALWALSLLCLALGWGLLSWRVDAMTYKVRLETAESRFENREMIAKGLAHELTLCQRDPATYLRGLNACRQGSANACAWLRP